MANQKYDSLLPLLASGNLNWPYDPIYGYLQRDASFTAANTVLSETGGTTVASGMVTGRSVSTEGLLGIPLSFPGMLKDQDYQVIIVKETGPADDALLLAFYDEDENGDPLRLNNNGTLIVRPVLVANGDPPTLGVWVAI